MSAPFVPRTARVSALATLVALASVAPRRALAAPLDQPIPLRLSYVVAAGSFGCPAEETFHALVAHHLEGTDPFTGKADSARVAVEVSRDGAGYKVVLTLYDTAGKRLDGINTPIKGNTCVSAVEAAGGVVVDLLPMRAPAPVVVDPLPVPAPAPAPAPKAAEPPSRSEIPPEDLPPAPPPAPPPKPPISWRAGAMLGVDVRSGTAPAFGVVADVSAKVSIFSFAVQFRAVPSAGLTPHSSAALYAGGLVACVRGDGQLGGRPFTLAGCGVGEVGGIQNAGATIFRTSVGAETFGGGGGRVQIEVPVTGSAYLQAAGDFEGLRGPASFLGGTVPAGSGRLGAGLSF